MKTEVEHVGERVKMASARIPHEEFTFNSHLRNSVHTIALYRASSSLMYRHGDKGNAFKG